MLDKLRAGDVLVVRWVDRLGRNHDDLCDTIREFMRRGMLIRTAINNHTFDGATEDAMQQAVPDALIVFMAATAQLQAEATKAAQRTVSIGEQIGDWPTSAANRALRQGFMSIANIVREMA